jgi:hypothetical protein
MRRVFRLVLKVLGYLALAIVAIPVLIGVAGGINAGIVSYRLRHFCARFPPGTALERFRSAAARENYSVYDQLSPPKTETGESGIAMKLLERRKKDRASGGPQISVIVRKPGIGFYACLAEHDGTTVSGIRFESSD